MIELKRFYLIEAQRYNLASLRHGHTIWPHWGRAIQSGLIEARRYNLASLRHGDTIWPHWGMAIQSDLIEARRYNLASLRHGDTIWPHWGTAIQSGLIEARWYMYVNWIIICSCKGLLPIGHQAITWNIIDSLNKRKIGPMGASFESKYKNFLSRKCIWKCYLQNGSHFVYASIC